MKNDSFRTTRRPRVTKQQSQLQAQLQRNKRSPSSPATTTMMLPAAAALLLLLIFQLLQLSQLVDAGGVQSGPSVGSFYPGGMYLDVDNQAVYVTGIQYNSDMSLPSQSTALRGSTVANEATCFVATIDLATGGSDFDAFETWTKYGLDDGGLTSCTALTLNGPSQLMVVGSAEINGIDRPIGRSDPILDPSIPLSGILLALDKTTLNVEDGTSLTTQSDPANKLLYPVSTVSDGTGNAMYVLALTSVDSVEVDNGSSRPNWIDDTIQKYGQSFDMTVIKQNVFQPTVNGIPDGPLAVEEEWTSEFPIDSEGPGELPPRVYLGGMIYKRNPSTGVERVIVAGSTRGLADRGYGLAIGNDEDGFILALDPTTGDEVKSEREGSAEDDIVTGICHDPNDPDRFYIVGATEGDLEGIQGSAESFRNNLVAGSLQPFIRQVQTETLKPSWTNQWVADVGGQAKTFAYAVGCAVDPSDGGFVYVAGTVSNNAGMVDDDVALPTNGKDDIWVAKLSVDDGSVVWMTQVGSSEDDRLAPDGGISINPTDDQLILYGRTNGSVYAFRDGQTDPNAPLPDGSDIFVMSLNKQTGVNFPSNNSFLGGLVTTNGDGGNSVPTGGTGTIPAPVEAPTPAALDHERPKQPTVRPGEHSFTAVGTQIVGPMYPGGVAYDDVQNAAFFAGMAFDGGSGKCMVGLVNLDNGDLDRSSFMGTTDKQEACSAITYSALDSTAFAVGNIEGGAGHFAESTWPTDSTSVQPGAIFEMSNRADFLGGDSFDGATAITPVAIKNDPGAPFLYIASMVTDDASVNIVSNPDFPNLTGGGDQKFGDNFYLNIQKWSIDLLPFEPVTDENGPRQTVSTVWDETYRPDDGSLSVTGLSVVGSGRVIVVVGSTAGSGGPFENNNADDIDGFVLKIDPETGKPIVGETSSSRVDSSNSKDDWVMGVCDDRFDEDSFYIVGASMGKVRGVSDEDQPPEGSLHGFVAKVRLDTLSEVWLKHFTMTSPTGGGIVEGEALACAVVTESEGNNIVYVAGTVQGGALMDGVTNIGQSNGNDDIWIASMDGDDGTMNWITQVGSSENDRLAAGGALAVDAFGNAIVLGETYGNLFGQRTQNDGPDGVLFTVNKKTGEFIGARPNGQGAGDGGNGNEVEDQNPIEYTAGSVNGFQTSADNGPSYAGGMVYDSFSNSVYITGATYGDFAGTGANSQRNSRCFLGIMSLPTLSWVDRDVVGISTVPEACSALTRPDATNGGPETILVGSTERNGLLTNLGSSSSDVEQYGIIVDMDGTTVVGGAVIDDNTVQVPIQVISGPNNDVYVVSMSSADARVSPDFSRAAKQEYPNYTTGGIEKYGSQYSILVEKHTIIGNSDAAAEDALLQETLSLDWRKPFQTEDAESIYVSGLSFIESRNALIAVGSTRGAQGGDDMDGIMAKISTVDGSFVSESSGARSVAFFSSTSNKDDWIMNVCTGDDSDTYFYVVGATRGSIDNTNKDESDETIHPIVAKIVIETLEIEWSRRFPITGGAQATDQIAGSTGLGCALVPREKYMYIAGNVERDATIENPDNGVGRNSNGGEDIFIARLDTDTGAVAWLQQIGTVGDDRLAHGGGIAVDNNGNAILYGDTTRELYREAEGNPTVSDVFVMIVDQERGDFLPPSNGSSSSSSGPPSNVIGIAVGVVLGLALFMIIFCYCMSQRQKRKRAEAQKSSIFAYLQQFDVEDIDLRKSPPGGWHGTYLNKLAYGINKAEMNGGGGGGIGLGGGGRNNESDGLLQVETAPLSHSSIVKDSLFMDTGSAPSLGGTSNGGFSDDLQQRRSGSREII